VRQRDLDRIFDLMLGLTRFQSFLTSNHCLRLLSSSSHYRCTYSTKATRLRRAYSMAHPTASSSQPAQIPALDSPHAAIAATNKDKAPKEKKGQGKSTNTSEASPYPLEVRSFCF
jgi:hypothetical protein